METVKLILEHPIATFFIVIAIGWSLNSIIIAFYGKVVK